MLAKNIKSNHQTNASKNGQPSTPRLIGQNEDDELKQQKPSAHLSTRSLRKPRSNKSQNRVAKSMPSSTENQPELTKERKEGALELGKVKKEGAVRADHNKVIASQEPTPHAQSQQNPSQRAPSGKRKRSRRRRKRSGGK